MLSYHLLNNNISSNDHSQLHCNTPHWKSTYLSASIAWCFLLQNDSEFQWSKKSNLLYIVFTTQKVPVGSLEQPSGVLVTVLKLKRQVEIAEIDVHHKLVSTHSDIWESLRAMLQEYKAIGKKSYVIVYLLKISVQKLSFLLKYLIF